MAPDYPRLENLMCGWFHQDFDLNGDTLEEIISAYAAATPLEQRRQLAAEIQQFLAESDDIDDRFQARFHPDVLPTGFASTTREFLQKIAQLV